MDIPNFSGKFANWKNFRDVYRSVIHRCETMTAVTKFYYLRTHLTGEAMEKIKSFSILGDNCERAWNTLTMYYENKRRIVGTHVSEIFSAKTMKAESSLELKHLVREIFNPLESLLTLDREGTLG